MLGHLGGKISDHWVLSTVKNGYRIQFRHRPPPFLGVHMTVKNKVQAQILSEEIATLLKKKVISQLKPNKQLKVFPCAKERWCIHKSAAVQDTDHCTNPGVYRTRRMVHNNRRIFSCTNSSRPQEVPSFCFSRPGVSVRSPPLWPLSITSCLHQGGVSDPLPSSGGRYKDPPISRRLADLCTKPSSGLGGHKDSYQSL